MASSTGDKKAIKQRNIETNKKLPTSEASSMNARSPKYKIKNRGSREKMQQSSEQRSFDVIDANDEEDINRVSMYSPGASPINSPNISSIPSTHFVSVTVCFELENVTQFLNSINTNRNMVITSVKRELMSCFMPGDQISSFNGISIWNRFQLDKELLNVPKLDFQKTKVTFVVIRAWNISCLTRNQLDRLSPPPDDRLHYFSVKVYCNNRAAGLYLRSEKKRLLVNHIRSKTAISFGLLVGDQLLGINDEMLVGNQTKVLYKQAKNLMLKSRKMEFIEMIACRPVLVRSSPAPSVDGELAMKATLKNAADLANKVEKKTNEDPASLPLEADALEIALRELTLLQQWIKIDKPLPHCEKGGSLLRFPSFSADQSTCPTERSERGTSSTTASSTMGPPTPDVPKKRGMIFRRRQQQTIGFTELAETSKVTSDISEEAELKKCDPRSGIVSYIKNAFNN